MPGKMSAARSQMYFSAYERLLSNMKSSYEMASMSKAINRLNEGKAH